MGRNSFKAGSFSNRPAPHMSSKLYEAAVRRKEFGSFKENLVRHRKPRSGHLCIGRTSLRTNVEQGNRHSAYLDCSCQMMQRRIL